jgi:hypothetical protein
LSLPQSSQEHGALFKGRGSGAVHCYLEGAVAGAAVVLELSRRFWVAASGFSRSSQ